LSRDQRVAAAADVDESGAFIRPTIAGMK